jgi:hypothetical protein
MSTILYETQTTSALGFDSTACAQNVVLFSQSNQTHNPFYVTWEGTITSNFSQAVGITYLACKEFCGTSYGTLDWVAFGTGITAWLFPWLALIAQLPFETRNAWGNIISFFICVGSPQLIAFSLAIHVLMSRRIHQCTNKLIHANQELPNHPCRDSLISTLSHACQFLVRSATSPIQFVSAIEFRQLIVDPRGWWEAVTKEMEKTEREWLVISLPLSRIDFRLMKSRTLSLRFQIIWVLAAQIISIALFFSSSSQQDLGTMGVTVNSLWIWMIPICLGWVWMGTQSTHNKLTDAIRGASTHLGGEPDESVMRGIKDCTYDTQYLTADEERTKQDGNYNGRTRRRKVLGCLIEGDMMEPGPVHIYTRLWTHMAVAMDLINGFWKLTQKLNCRDTAPNLHENGTDAHNSLEAEDFEINSLALYPPNRPKYLSIILLATMISLFVQWGATGSAIVIAYL